MQIADNVKLNICKDNENSVLDLVNMLVSKDDEIQESAAFAVSFLSDIGIIDMLPWIDDFYSWLSSSTEKI